MSMGCRFLKENGVGSLGTHLSRWRWVWGKGVTPKKCGFPLWFPENEPEKGTLNKREAVMKLSIWGIFTAISGEEFTLTCVIYSQLPIAGLVTC